MKSSRYDWRNGDQKGYEAAAIPLVLFVFGLGLRVRFTVQSRRRRDLQLTLLDGTTFWDGLQVMRWFVRMGWR